MVIRTTEVPAFTLSDEQQNVIGNDPENISDDINDCLEQSDVTGNQKYLIGTGKGRLQYGFTKYFHFPISDDMRMVNWETGGIEMYDFYLYNPYLPIGNEAGMNGLANAATEYSTSCLPSIEYKKDTLRWEHVLVPFRTTLFFAYFCGNRSYPEGRDLHVLCQLAWQAMKMRAILDEKWLRIYIGNDPQLSELRTILESEIQAHYAINDDFQSMWDGMFYYLHALRFHIS